MNKFFLLAVLLLFASMLLGQDCLRAYMYIDNGNLATPLYMPDGTTPIPDGCLVEFVIPAADTLNYDNDFHGTQLHNVWAVTAINGEATCSAPGFFYFDYFKWEDRAGSPEEPVANCGSETVAADQIYIRIFDGPSVGGSTHYRNSALITGPMAGSMPLDDVEIINWGDWVTLPGDGNGAPNLATPITLPCDGTIYSIGDSTDVDWYRFSATEGQTLNIFTTLPVGSLLDPKIWLYGPASEDGSEIQEDVFVASDDNTYGNFQPQVQYTVPTTGNYFLRVGNSATEPTAGRELSGLYYLFVFTSAIPHNPPTELQAFVNQNDVTLIWQAPGATRAMTRENRRHDMTRPAVTGYKVYRDGTLIGQTDALNRTYSDNDLADGTYNYTVKAMYNDWAESAPTPAVEVIIITEAHLAPINFTVTLNGYYTAHLDWDAPVRPIVAYRVYRNGVFLTQIATTAYDDQNLLPGEYSYYVKTLYTGGIESPATPTLSLTIEQINTPTGLTATVNLNDVHLAWTATPGQRHGIGSDHDLGRRETEVTRSVVSHKVYRNNTLIATVPVPTLTYDDADLADGTYSYTVTAVYGNGVESATSAPAIAVVDMPNPFLPPTHLQGYIENDYDVVLNWQRPGWLLWDTGENDGAIGLETQAADFIIASRWTPGDLTPYLGATLSEISFFPRLQACQYYLRVWTGGSHTGATYTPGTMLVDQLVANPVIDDWNTVTLTTPVTIPANQELWFGVRCNSQPGFPAGCDGGPMIDGKGNLIFFNNAWTELDALGAGLTYNWNLHAKVSYATPRGVATAELGQTPLASCDGVPTFSPSAPSAHHPEASRDVSSFHVFRNGVQIHTVDDPNIMTWTDENVTANTYNYWVTASYTNPNGTSDPSNTFTITVAQVNYLPPINLQATIQDGNSVHLTWLPPGADATGASEDFESGSWSVGWAVDGVSTDESHSIPGYWTINQAAGDDFEPQGNYHAGLYWSEEHQDEWLITPTFHCPAASHVSFNTVAYYGSTYGDHYTVQITTDNGQNWTTLWDATAQTGAAYHVYGTPIQLDLAAYAGQYVKVAFHAYDGDGAGLWWYFFVDDITVGSPEGVLSFDGSDLQANTTRQTRTAEFARVGELVNRDGSVTSLDSRDRPLLYGYKVYRDGTLLTTITDLNHCYYDDTDLPSGAYSYYVTALYNGGDVESEHSNTADALGSGEVVDPTLVTGLKGISPNPFNPSTRIDYSLANPGRVTITVLNIRGQKVATLVDDVKAPGNYSVNWNGTTDEGRNVPSGVYFSNMKTGDGRYTVVKKMILLK